MRTLFSATIAGLMASTAFAQTPDRTVFFALGSDAIDDAGMTELDGAATDFTETGSTSVSIVGHTDTTGSAEFNMELSRRRAEAVAAELIARGVPADEIVTAWRGQNELAVQTADNVNEPLNRRAEIALAEPPAPPPVEEPAIAALPSLAIGLGPYFGYNMEEDDESYFVGGNLSASYFVTPNIALSAEQAVFYNLDARDEGWGGRTLAGVDYHFAPYGTGTSFIPYVGANVGYMYIDGTGTGGFFGGPEIGATIFGIKTKIAYDMVESRDLGDGVISVTIGYDFLF